MEVSTLLYIFVECMSFDEKKNKHKLSRDANPYQLSQESLALGSLVI